MDDNVNTGGFFSDRLEALIAAALQDGVLTDKERELLKRRAEKEGEDWDEVEMIIEARLAEIQAEKNTAATAMPQIDAVESGNADELYNMGVGCYNSQNYEEAVMNFRKASELGHTFAQVNLGFCYECGYGVAQDYEEAARWYRIAAEQGDADAQYSIGELFYFGRGVPQNYQKAKEWWQKAAEQGNQDAIDCLNGKTPEDDEEDSDDSDAYEESSIFEGDYYQDEKEIVIPEGVTVIAVATCRDSEKLEKLTLPSTLVTIENMAFYNCTKLKTVDFTLCKHLKEIGESAFEYCETLEKIDLSQCSQLESIGECSFGNCTKLRSIDIPDSVMSIGVDAFSSCNALTRVVLPASLEEAEQNLFGSCEKLEEIDLSKCTQLKSLSWTSLSSCDNLRKIVLPASLEEIENTLFNYCTKLEEVDFSLSTQMKRIGDEAFYYCEKLKDIVLPDTITFIGQEAFAYCGTLKQIVLPASLEKMEDNVFHCCKLESIDMSKVTHLSTIPKGFGCTKSMMIPQGVTTIVDSAFYSQYPIKCEQLFLPSTLESYGKGNGTWNAIYLYAPLFDDLETLLERNKTLYVLPQYLNDYTELWEALDKPNEKAEILPIPDEYLYYYDN